MVSADTEIPPLPNSNDPYLILNLKPTSNAKEIKRAYKQMALKYHPDVRINSNSSPEERKRANDDFSRINAAYAYLTGKSDESPRASTKSSKNNRASASKYSAPHRRSRGPSSASESSFSDWKDYMPKYEDVEYDAGGDSFSSILGDLLSQLGSSAESSGSILSDLISFLEGNFPSIGSKKSAEEDLILDSLLRNGSLEEIRLELDEAKLLVKQLETKEIDLAAESKVIEDEQTGASNARRSYMQDMRLDEKRREVEARKSVVGDYLLRAKVRQMKLRKRLDELEQEKAEGIPKGRTKNSNSSSGSSSSTDFSNTNRSQSRDTKSSYQKSEVDEDSWKTESFSSGRRRGRSRSQNVSFASNPFPSSKSSAYVSSSGEERTESYHRDEKSPSKPSTQNANIPPHRRIASSFKEQAEAKRRLREIKVDEEIDKMKKELGL